MAAKLLPTSRQFSSNLQRLLAKQGLTLAAVVERTGVDERTVRAILAGSHKPQARTLHKLAVGLDVAADEFFQDPALLAYRSSDRITNPLVDEVIESHPQLFEGWSHADFDELYSRFGAGGALTREGTIEAAEQMNRKHQLMQKVALLLETGEADLLAEMIEILYKRVVIVQPKS